MSTYNPSTLNQTNRATALAPTPQSLSWHEIASPPREAPVTLVPSLETGPGVTSARDAELEPLRLARRNATSAFEVRYLEALLSRSGGSISRAAALSKVSRQMLQKLMRKHRLTMPR